MHTTQGEGPLTDNPLEISDATSDGPEDWAEGDDLPVVEVRGGPLEAPVTVDLAESDRTIVRTTDAQKYGIRVSDYLI